MAGAKWRRARWGGPGAIACCRCAAPVEDNRGYPCRWRVRLAKPQAGEGAVRWMGAELALSRERRLGERRWGQRERPVSGGSVCGGPWRR